MYSVIIVFNLDSNLGRVDYSSFSDHTLMEMLYEGFDEGLWKICNYKVSFIKGKSSYHFQFLLQDIKK